MYNSGDAAEQVVRISLEGTEVALKLTGSAAKNIAAMLYAVWKNRDKNKAKGHQRLSAMLKSGKELKVFTVSEEHLKQFATEAKRYGVVYCALRGKERSADGMESQTAYKLLFTKYPDVVNVQQMCEMLGGICDKTAYKLLRSGEIRSFVIGRRYCIPKLNILKYLELVDKSSA